MSIEKWEVKDRKLSMGVLFFFFLTMRKVRTKGEMFAYCPHL